MAITEKDKQALSGLAFRALDTIENEYGEEAEFVAAVIVFEIKIPGPNASETDDETHWFGNYESTVGSSPHHISGLLHAAADKIVEEP